MNISVCMATYNGQDYIIEQIKSIISQIKLNDEIIIVDDCSKDSTVELIESLNDSRIKIFKNKTNMGHVFSFNRSINLAKYEVIFLSDQDDIWVEGRVRLMLEKLNNKLLVSSNFNNFSGDFNNQSPSSSPLKESDSSKNFKNIFRIFLGKSDYFGCAMAFRKDLINTIIPIPKYVESHDLWIAMCANLMNSNIHLDKITLLRRLHHSNLTNLNRPLSLKLKSRIIIFVSLLILSFRIIKNKKNYAEK